MNSIDILFRIIRAVVSGTNETLPEFDVNEVFMLAKKHKLENFVCRYLEQKKMLDSYPAILKAYEPQIAVDSNQQYYLELLTDEFEKNGIKHIPLKGSVIKKLYPSSELRQSADIDIYIPEECAARAKTIMESHGFEAVKYGVSIHDEYRMDIMVYVELHKELVSSTFKWHDICVDIVENSVPDEGSEYRYHMTDEDFYVFMLIHMAKHVLYGGAGIRMVLDVWVYLNKINMDEQVLRKRLAEAELLDFDVKLRKLCRLWFENEKTDDESVIMLSRYLIESGWNGTSRQIRMTNYMRRRTKNKSELERYASSVFLPLYKMKKQYPVLKSYPILLPFMWAHRIWRAVFIKKGAVRNVAHYYDDIKDDEITAFEGFTRSIGL